MKAYSELTRAEAAAEMEKLMAQYAAFQAKGLKLDMSRGKPCPLQLDLSMDMLNEPAAGGCFSEDGTDSSVSPSAADSLPRSSVLTVKT